MRGPAVSRGLHYLGPTCPHCGRQIDLAETVTGPQTCPRCRKGYLALRFTPPARVERVVSLAEAGPAGANACGNHPANMAVLNCERCGIFMCALCRTEADERVLCPACFQRLWQEQGLPSARHSVRDEVGLALFLAVLGLVTVVAGVLAGPLALWLDLRGWRAARRAGVHASLTQAITAAVLALAAVAACVLFWTQALSGAFSAWG